MEEKLFTECQYGFIPGGSCVAQLLTHVTLCSILKEHLQIFLKLLIFDFDKVWHEGLISKLKSYGIGGNPLKLLENYLKAANKELL